VGELLESVARFFEDDGWAYSRLGNDMLRAPCTGEHGEWICYARALEDPPALIVYSSCPFAIPEDRRLEMAELLCRANWGLMLGAFEMDLADGELRYRTGQAMPEGGFAPAHLGKVIYENVLAMDRYLPAIEAVAWLGSDAKSAVAAVEREDG
jgi:hypothetical protein